MTNVALLAALIRQALIAEFGDYAVSGPTIKSFRPVTIDVERVARRVAAGLDDEPAAALRAMLEDSLALIEEEGR